MSRLRSISALLVDVPTGSAVQLERVLEAAGWKVRALSVSGAEGLTAALQRRGWQVVLYGGEGRDAVPSRKALALVRLADPHLPFIAVSAQFRRGDLAALVHALPPGVPTVSDPAQLPAVLTREVEQARMRRRVGGAHTLLDAQQAISDHLAAGLEPDALCARALATLGESLGWSFGAVWRPSGATLECTSVWHAPGARGPVTAFAAETPNLTFAPGQGLPGRVWAFRRTAWVADVGHESNMPRADHALRAGLVTAVAFPLAAADECHGVIEFYSAAIREPNAEVAAMFASVGGQLAQYLSRRRVRTRARRSLDGATALVVGLDADGRVELANATACAKLGVDEQRLIGHDWFATALPEPQRASARTAFARLLAGEHGDFLALEQPLTGGDGRLCTVSWRWSLARDAGGRVAGALGWGEPVEQPSPTGGNGLVAELAAALAARDRT